MDISSLGLSSFSGKRDLITNYIYFYHLDKFVIIPVFPESVADSFTSSWTPTSALGRTSQAQSYGYSDNAERTFTIALHRDLMESVNVGVSNLKDNTVNVSQDDYIDILVKEMLAMALPSYEEYVYGNKSMKPPIAAIRFGNQIFMKGVVKNVTVTYKGPLLEDNKYAQADISFVMKEFDPYDAETIEQLGSFRGLTNTLDIFKNDNRNSSTVPEADPNYTVTTKNYSYTNESIGRQPTTLLNRLQNKVLYKF